MKNQQRNNFYVSAAILAIFIILNVWHLTIGDVRFVLRVLTVLFTYMWGALVIFEAIQYYKSK